MLSVVNKLFMLSFNILGVANKPFMLSVMMLNVVILNAIAPFY